MIEEFNLHPAFPVDEVRQLLFIGYCHRTVQGGTMSGYLCAVRSLQADLGYQVHKYRPFRVRRMIDSLKKSKGSGHRVKLPITFAILLLLSQHVDLTIDNS